MSELGGCGSVVNSSNGCDVDSTSFVCWALEKIHPIDPLLRLQPIVLDYLPVLLLHVLCSRNCWLY
jgi:hypothetical protein